jgi:hypothetical protein
VVGSHKEAMATENRHHENVVKSIVDSQDKERQAMLELMRATRSALKASVPDESGT